MRQNMFHVKNQFFTVNCAIIHVFHSKTGLISIFCQPINLRFFLKNRDIFEKLPGFGAKNAGFTVC